MLRKQELLRGLAKESQFACTAAQQGQWCESRSACDRRSMHNDCGCSGEFFWRIAAFSDTIHRKLSAAAVASLHVSHLIQGR